MRKGCKMTDDEIIGLFWKRSEEAISEAKMKYGGYCAAVSRNILQDEIKRKYSLKKNRKKRL